MRASELRWKAGSCPKLCHVIQNQWTACVWKKIKARRKEDWFHCGKTYEKWHIYREHELIFDCKSDLIIINLGGVDSEWWYWKKVMKKVQELNNGTVTGAYYMFWLISLVLLTVAHWCDVNHTARCSELAVPPSEVLTVWWKNLWTVRVLYWLCVSIHSIPWVSRLF